MEQLKFYRWSGSVRLIQYGSWNMIVDDTAITAVSFDYTSHWHRLWIDWNIKTWYNDLLGFTVVRLTCKLGNDGEYSVLWFELTVNLPHLNYWWLNIITKMTDIGVCSYQNRELTQLICKSFFFNVTVSEDLQFFISSIRACVRNRPSALILCYRLLHPLS